MPRANKSKKNKQPVSHPTTKHVAVAKEKIQHQRQQADTRTTKEIEAAKKAHKDQKRIRKKRENGGVVHNDEDYQRIRAQLQEATERNNYPLERPRTFYVPEDVTPLEIKKRDPDMYQRLSEGNIPKASQKDSVYRTRAIWLNDYDRKRTFNPYHQQCRMLFAIIKYRQKHYNDLTRLEKLFLGAALERRDDSKYFDDRNDFIKEWLESDYDLYVFPKKDLKGFRTMVKDMKNALPKIMSAVGQEQRRPNLSKAGSAFLGLAANNVHSTASAFASDIGGSAPSPIAPISSNMDGP